jgi:hypothetical protein
VVKISPVVCVLVEIRSEGALLLRRTWPVFADELAAVLEAAGEDQLTDQVDRLRIVAVCVCEDDLCQSFYTAAKPAGTYGDGHRNVCLDPPWPGYLVLDVVHDNITYVEVLDRPPLR